MRRVIQESLECHNLCVETVTYCFQQGGEHADAPHLRLLLDCAEICKTSADFMLRGSAFHRLVCGVSAELCERCAQSCERFGGDARMKLCAEVCRRGAVSFLEMSRMAS